MKTNNIKPTYRDELALKSLELLIAHRSWRDLEGESSEVILKTWAKGAYALADAMLEARENDHQVP